MTLMSANGLIKAIEQIQSDQIASPGADGVVEILKAISVSHVGAYDDLVYKTDYLAAQLAEAKAERDVARAKIKDLRDVNVLHSLILAMGAGLLGCYASYDSAGRAKDHAILLYLSVGCIAIWVALLIYRILRTP